MIRGVGLYDGDGSTFTDPFYKTWHNMIERCYSSEFHRKYPTYKDCSVCAEWLIYSKFRAWMETQKWQGNQLDKDFTSFGNKQYSPDMCCFVPAKINSLMQECFVQRGSLPVGVYMASGNLKKPYRARVSTILGTKHLGYFATPESGNKAWCIGKTVAIVEAIEWWKTDLKVSESFNTNVEKTLLGFKKELVNVG